METENWYLANKSKILRQVRFAVRHFRKHLAETYGKAEGEAITTEALQRFELLLPDIPYVGGDENRLTQGLYMNAAWLALYQTLRARGETVEDALRLLYRLGSRFMSSFPMRLLLRWEGSRMFGRKVVEQRRREALVSQGRGYPGDWVFEFVDGDGRTFEYGLDYSECGIVKYLRREGAPELAPLACWLDYPAFAARGVRLTRSETLALGGQRCDFRFSRGEPAQVEPEFSHV